MKEKLLLVGYGMVGHRFLEEFKDLGGFERWEVTVLSEEDVRAYDRVNLSKLFYEQSYDLFFPSTDIFINNGVKFFYNSKVIRLDLQNNFAVLDNATKFGFDRCVLATGSYPFVPPVQGYDDQSCFTYRSIANATQIIEKAKTCSTALVIGGGLLGIEAAAALQNLDLEVEVIERSERVLPTQLDEQGSLLLEKKLRQQGLGLKLSHVVKKMKTCDDKSLEVEVNNTTNDDAPRIIKTDMVVFSVGVRPNDHLAFESGLAISPRGGIEVDSTCRTSCESVYAIGECASFGSRCYGLVGPGYQMAKIAACNIIGIHNEITYLDTSTTLKLAGLPVASFGNPFIDDDSNQIIYCDPSNSIYRVLVTSKQENQLLGGILLGDSSNFSLLRSLVLDSQNQPSSLFDLVLPQNNDDIAAYSTCECNEVSFKQVNDLIKENQFISLDEVAKTLGLDSECRTCLVNVKSWVDESSKNSLNAKSYICFHFDYSIEEIYRIVSINHFTDFDNFIEAYGRGRGCRDCKIIIEDAIQKQKLAVGA